MEWTARIALVVMLVADGLWAGIILLFAVERVNLWSRMPVAQYVVDFRRSVYRADPLQPILGIVAIIGGVYFALNVGGGSSAFAWTGVVLIVIVIAMSIALPERINSQFRRRAEGDAPPDAANLRLRWQRLHLIRTVPAVGSLVAMAVAAGLTG